LPVLRGSFRNRVEQTQSAQRPTTRARLLRLWRLSVRTSLVRRRTLRSFQCFSGRVAHRHGTVVDSDLLAQRVCSGARPISAHELRSRSSRQRVLRADSVFNRSAWGARVLMDGRNAAISEKGFINMKSSRRIALVILAALLATTSPAGAQSKLNVVATTEDL